MHQQSGLKDNRTGASGGGNKFLITQKNASTIIINNCVLYTKTFALVNRGKEKKILIRKIFSTNIKTDFD